MLRSRTKRGEAVSFNHRFVEINKTFNLSRKTDMITINFVLYRVQGHPEIKYESVLKNKNEASHNIETDRWQIIESTGAEADSQSKCCYNIGRNRCYLCEKAPYTIFFYQREVRNEHFT